MSKMKALRSCILLLSLVFSNIYSKAQLVVDVDMTPDQMVQNLVGEGVQISNVSVTAADSSFGYFYSTATELGTSQGLLLSTGLAPSAIGPNNSSGLPILCGLNCCVNCDVFDNNFEGSPLLDLAQDRETFDMCMIEFDIVPQGDSLRFSYTFASEEYQEWVGSPFNDVFGFYITGPNVGTDVNIALVPGTSDAVAINNVNHLSNSQYYFNNSAPPGQFVQFDGFTIGLNAEVGNLIPCETYHLKLIIADGSDRLYDSGVFVNAIESNPVLVVTATAGGLPYMIEDCNNGILTFAREEASPSPQNITYYVGGTATDGVDYLPQLGTGNSGDPITVTIPANELSTSIDLSAIADGITEGEEYITIYLQNPLCSNLNVLDSINFYIHDFLEVEIAPQDPVICLGDCVELTGIAETEGTATFEWSPTTGLSDPLSLITDACPTENTTYTLTSQVSDCISSATVEVTVSEILLELIGSEVNCNGGFTGTINLNIVGGVPEYSFDWTGPNGFVSNSEDLSGLEAGEYCVTVMDDAGCTSSACITLIETNPLEVLSGLFSDFTCFPISCFGACDGSIDITVAGGFGNYSYSWNGPGLVNDPIEDPSSLCAGTYTVTVTDDAGCVVTEDFVLDEPDPVTIDLVGQVNVLCNGTETGEATVTAFGGCQPYTYSWSHDVTLTTPVADNLGTGLYTVTVTDVNGCSSDDEVNIEIGEPQLPLTVTIDEISLYPGGYGVSCYNAADGYVNITVSGGTIDYTYSWYNQDLELTVSTNQDLSDAPCGDYTLTVTDSNGCSFTANVEITCVPPVVIEYTVTPNPCADPNAGFGGIDITSISGGQGPIYTVEYFGPGCNSCPGEDLINVNSGNYTVVITDGLGCTQFFDINIGTNDGFTLTSDIVNASCFDICNGSIDITLVPDISYTYDWDGPNGFDATTQDVSGLCGGTYSVEVTAAGCSGVFNFGIAQPNEIEIDVVSIIQPVCSGQNTGSIDIEVSGTMGSPEFEWTAAEGCVFFGATTEDISGLFECCYTVVVTDQNGCDAEEEICLDAPQVMNIFVETSNYNGGFNVSCDGANDGAITVTVSGGTPDCNVFSPYCYLYDWSNCDDVVQWGNDPNSNIVDGLPGGVYCINVTDINGCLATTTINLSEPDPIADGGFSTDPLCNGGTGSITLSLSGGSGNYVDFDWTQGDIGSNNESGPVLTDLEPGDYTLVVTDSNGCSDEFNYTINDPSPVQINLEFVQQISCDGDEAGAISFNVTGGSGVYFIETTDQDNNVYPGTFLTNLPAGTYTIYAEDEFGCSDTEVVEIIQPVPMDVDLTILLENENQQYSVPCFGDQTGSISSTITNGTPEFTFEWQDSEGNVIGTEQDITGLGAGFYCLTVTDASLCEVVECAEITEPETPLVVDTEVSLYNKSFNISCNNACDGWIDLTVSGGVPGYTYLWETGEGEFITTEDLADLCADTYEVLVVDSNFCTQLIDFELNQPPPITVDSEVSVYGCGYNVSCAESCDGTISIFPNGGVPGYSIEWVELGIFDETEVTGLCAGQYTVIITDAIGCEFTSIYELIEPNPIIATAETDVVCDEGILNVCAVISGGCPQYSINWSTGETQSCITILSSGVYTGTVVDSNGCISEVNIIIDDIPEIMDLDISYTGTTCGACNGSVTVEVTGGAPNFNYDWTGAGTSDVNNTAATSDTQEDLCPGNYSVTVTDNFGCSVTESETIPLDNPIEVTPVVVPVDCYGNSTGSISVTISNTTDPLIITWTDSQGNQIGTGAIIFDLAAGTYTMNWEDGAGCFGNEDYTITQPSEITIDALYSEYGEFNVSEYGATDGWIDVIVSGGSGGYVYTWIPSTADTTTFYDGLGAGSYSLTVTDESGCSRDTTFVLTGPEVLDLPTGLSPNNDELNDVYVIQGVEGFKDNTFKVFNRWGNVVYEKENYQNDWYGQNTNGDDLPDGTYYVIFIASEFEFNTYVDLRR